MTEEKEVSLFNQTVSNLVSHHVPKQAAAQHSAIVEHRYARIGVLRHLQSPQYLYRVVLFARMSDTAFRVSPMRDGVRFIVVNDTASNCQLVLELV